MTVVTNSLLQVKIDFSANLDILLVWVCVIFAYNVRFSDIVSLWTTLEVKLEFDFVDPLRLGFYNFWCAFLNFFAVASRKIRSAHDIGQVWDSRMKSHSDLQSHHIGVWIEAFSRHLTTRGVLRVTRPNLVECLKKLRRVNSRSKSMQLSSVDAFPSFSTGSTWRKLILFRFYRMRMSKSFLLLH